ncbi:anti-sigma factor antagonist [Actinoplanes sp. NBRC 14428]|uniref:Anti-sigma factor antagonist n=1 Tax=Pseudosporangium ferrugineum TaxID=439699 RepID=A0A2T0S904_9ACTN|nr:STAS domain-containing protein [Pseudosporangium ferrugineum]PRY29900.1 anti-sigma B factor antagonist [Pseudosporangium ferrugineum]BCJ50870.1 anti-sigma factor antagonist [Actinoplanes sp. NBRC 14428]
MKVSRTADRGALRLTPAGELDLATAEPLLAHVRTALAQRPDALVVDLREVTFCDSSGIGALLDAYALATAAGTAFRIDGPRPVIRRSMQITGVLGLLTG